MEPSNKHDLLAGMTRNFTRLELELDTLPPVLFNDRRISPHVGEQFIDACDVLAHAIGWTELALGWVERTRARERPVLPEAGCGRDELDRLSAGFYLENNTGSFRELRDRLRNVYDELIELLGATDENLLFKTEPYREKTTGQLIHCHVSALYEGEVTRLRVWKKGLGWV
jgi:hypothetical protein